jgi:hypothetical protein
VVGFGSNFCTPQVCPKSPLDAIGCGIGHIAKHPRASWLLALRFMWLRLGPYSDQYYQRPLDTDFNHDQLRKSALSQNDGGFYLGGGCGQNLECSYRGVLFFLFYS